MRRMATYSPVGLYLARFTVINSSKPRPSEAETDRYHHQQEESLRKADLVLGGLGLTYDRAQLIGAVVWKEAPHGISAWERAQRRLTVLMGLSQKTASLVKRGKTK